ncbi:MAG: 3-deoxy-manno-octulosonate cytidylyltransferase [Gammaproteobacteria bacterium]|nr:3-deoxy-manno-octulosonate cytidylyltransferase [Gammaproteobacteria bacterium]
MDFRVVIPARYASTRLPGKPLLPIAGRPMLQHVHERALQCGASSVVIATDDERIRDAAAAFNATVCMTAPEHVSGTERIGEVVERLGWGDDVLVVNVQGDEPMIAPALIRQVATGLSANADAAVATLAWPLDDMAELQDPNIVKVVLDRAGYALYFSRAAIPYARDVNSSVATGGLRHIGLYAYRAGFLASYARLPVSPLEQVEKLEQLRVLWNGLKIHVSIAEEMPGPGVDTPADLERVGRLLAGAAD